MVGMVGMEVVSVANVCVEVKVDEAVVDVRTGRAMEGAETERRVEERELAEGAGVTVSRGGVEGGTETVRTGTGLLGELDRE